MRDPTKPHLCCSRLVRSSSSLSVRQSPSLVRSSDDGLTPLGTAPNRRTVSALRDLVPVVVTVEHSLQPITNNRAQLLPSWVGHVYQRRGPQGFTPCHEVSRENRAGSPPLTAHRQSHIGDPVHGCPNVMPTSQISADTFSSPCHVFQYIRASACIPIARAQRRSCDDITLLCLARRRGDPTTRALQVTVSSKVSTSFAYTTSKASKKLRLELSQRDTLMPCAHVVHEASCSPSLENAPRTFSNLGPTNSHGKH